LKLLDVYLFKYQGRSVNCQYNFLHTVQWGTFYLLISHFFDTLNTGDTEELVVTSNINNELKTRIEKQVERKFSRITNTNFTNNSDLFITFHLLVMFDNQKKEKD